MTDFYFLVLSISLISPIVILTLWKIIASRKKIGMSKDSLLNFVFSFYYCWFIIFFISAGLQDSLSFAFMLSVILVFIMIIANLIVLYKMIYKSKNDIFLFFSLWFIASLITFLVCCLSVLIIYELSYEESWMEGLLLIPYLWFILASLIPMPIIYLIKYRRIKKLEN